MKISASMWCVQRDYFKGKTTVEEFIKFVWEQNIDGIELLDCFLKSPEEQGNAVKLLEKLGMKVSAFSIGNDFVVKDEVELESQINYVKTGIETAAAFGTNLLRVFSGSVKEGISIDQGTKNIIRGFEKTVRYAEKNNITMVLENHGMFAGRSEQVLEIINTIGSPNLMANADTGNFLLVLENPVEAVKKLDKKIGFIHFKDFKKIDRDNGKEYYTALDSTLYQGTPIGKGDIDLLQIVSYMRERDYKGYFSIEYEGVGDCYTETKESIEYLKGILGTKI